MTCDNFLENLYYGNVSPADRKLDKQSKSYQILTLECDAQDEFRKKLSDDLKKEFDNLVSLSISKCCESEKETFIYACKYMLRFILACLDDDAKDFVFRNDRIRADDYI